MGAHTQTHIPDAYTFAADPVWSAQTSPWRISSVGPQETAAGRSRLQDYRIQPERFCMTAEGRGNYLWPFSVWLREITQLPPDLFLKGATAAKWDLRNTLCCSVCVFCVLYTLKTRGTGREGPPFLLLKNTFSQMYHKQTFWSWTFQTYFWLLGFVADLTKGAVTRRLRVKSTFPQQKHGYISLLLCWLLLNVTHLCVCYIFLKPALILQRYSRLSLEPGSCKCKNTWHI